ncbi:hypothetical protein HDU79_000802, partial [Rhizoclosmatium sp. JEL0117]
MSSASSDYDTEMSPRVTPQAMAQSIDAVPSAVPPTTAPQLNDLLQAYHELRETNRFLMQELEALRRSTAATPVYSVPVQPVQPPFQPQPAPLNVPQSVNAVRSLPDFKMPSVKPLIFNGNIKNKPAH